MEQFINSFAYQIGTTAVLTGLAVSAYALNKSDKEKIKRQVLIGTAISMAGATVQITKVAQGRLEVMSI